MHARTPVTVPTADDRAVRTRAGSGPRARRCGSRSRRPCCHRSSRPAGRAPDLLPWLLLRWRRQLLLGRLLLPPPAPLARPGACTSSPDARPEHELLLLDCLVAVLVLVQVLVL